MCTATLKRLIIQLVFNEAKFCLLARLSSHNTSVVSSEDGNLKDDCSGVFMYDCAVFVFFSISTNYPHYTICVPNHEMIFSI